MDSARTALIRKWLKSSTCSALRLSAAMRLSVVTLGFLKCSFTMRVRIASLASTGAFWLITMVPRKGGS
ncbi:hypothetical protein D3C71_2221270 [compost metagenome]